MSTPYERLVQELHQALLHSDGVENINVLHNVKIKGRSGATHQIDVYWEFKLAGVTYKTCIECKHYNTSVKKSHIASFSAVLEDIGNSTGIFATTEGYQQGAVLFAQAKGIRLLLVNPLLKTVAITINSTVPSTTITAINYNKEHVSERLVALGVESYDWLALWTPERELCDVEGNVKTTFQALFKGKTAQDGDFELHTPGIYDQTEIGLIEIESINYSVKTHHDQRTFEITTNNIERAIIEDVLQNTSLYLN
ncbi:MAG: restriction endonuclease, partial [Parachlamydiaceae bacterium]